MPRLFYRIVHSDQPTLDDFKSAKALGIPMARPDPEIELIYDGVSVYATETQARNQARAKPFLGAYIAELAISEGDPITFRRSGTGRGHHTLWGDPADIKARVQRVIAITATPREADATSMETSTVSAEQSLQPPSVSVEDLLQRPTAVAEKHWSLGDELLLRTLSERRAELTAREQEVLQNLSERRAESARWTAEAAPEGEMESKGRDV